MTIDERSAAFAQQNSGAPPDVIEAFFLHFFANLNLAAVALEALAPLGFTLTKHRILGIATLTPGITVGELVGTLRVTHQAINAPMRELLSGGYVVARIGSIDRRQRQLFATAKGERIFRSVLSVQMQEIERAFALSGRDARNGFLEVHRHLISATDTEWLRRFARTAEQPSR